MNNVLDLLFLSEFTQHKGYYIKPHEKLINRFIDFCNDRHIKINYIEKYKAFLMIQINDETEIDQIRYLFFKDLVNSKFDFETIF